MIALVPLALPGCMATGVQFAGERQAPVVNAAGVQVAERPPTAARRLGRAQVECSPLAPQDEIAGARYSDVSCSAALLHAALRDAAAEAGGTFTSVPECEEKRASSGEATRLSWIGCSAEVWTTASGRAGGVPPLSFEEVRSSAVAGAPHPGSLRDAWRISLDFWPAASGARRAARDAAALVEVDFPRIGQRRLGDLSAQCAEGCAADSLRRGLRAAAAWLGASTLVGVRCVQRGAAQSCVASISAPEVDEAQLAGNR